MKMRTHSMFSTLFPRKSHRSWGNVEKYGRDREATGDIAIRRRRFGSWVTRGCRHTLRICISYWFSTAVVVTLTHPSVRCVSCYQYCGGVFLCRDVCVSSHWASCGNASDADNITLTQWRQSSAVQQRCFMEEVNAIMDRPWLAQVCW